MNNYRLGTSTSGLYPDHKFETKYFYNSSNQVVRQVTPDGGTSNFAYDKLVRLGVSQNAQQEIDEKVSYTLYDKLGRIYETGEVHSPSVTLSIPGENAVYLTYSTFEEGSETINLLNIGAPISVLTSTFGMGTYNLSFTQFEFLLRYLDYKDFKTLIESQQRNDVVTTLYDQKAPSDRRLADYGAGESLNLRNRVSAMHRYKLLSTGSESAYENAIHYHYDAVGNVRRIIREFKNTAFSINTYKIMEYEYDQISGNVIQFSYQPGEEDSWYHRYEYDKNNRLTEVSTSRNGDIWDKDGVYDYYLHGPLASLQLGEYIVQKNDYAYTLQGWLKMINGLKDISEYDATIPEDAYSLELNYYSGSNPDYKPVTSTAYSGANASAVLNAGNSLYNGNIQGLAQRTVVKTSTNQDSEFESVAKNYDYDQLNRIKYYFDRTVDMSSSIPQWTGTNGLTGITSDYSFDGAGNIRTLNRSALQSQSSSSLYPMDELAYSYYPNTNKLRNYHEVIDDNLFSQDLDNTGNLGTYFYIQSEVTNGMNPGEYGVYCLDNQEQFANIHPFDPNGVADWSINSGTWEYKEQNAEVFTPGYFIEAETLFVELSECGYGGSKYFWIVKVTAPLMDGYIYDLTGNLIIDNNEHLEIDWNPQGKVERVTFDQQEENSQVFSLHSNTPLPNGFPSPNTYNYSCGPTSGNHSVPYQFQTLTEGQTSFDYDPLGERMLKHNSVIKSHCIICHTDPFSGACFEPVESQSFELYMRDAQGNVIALYNLDTNMEAINHYEFYDDMLRNIRDPDGLNVVSLQRDLMDKLVLADDRFMNFAFEYSGMSESAILNTLDIENILDDNPHLLASLMTEFPEIHLNGFFDDDDYADWVKTQIRASSAYQSYATIKAEALALEDMEDLLNAYNEYDGDIQADAEDLFYNNLMVCAQNSSRCQSDLNCLNCEPDLIDSDIFNYDRCMTNNGCDPAKYCGDCSREWDDYRAVADLLRVPYDFNQLKITYYNDLMSGSGLGANEENYFDLSVTPKTPLSHTEQVLTSSAITSSSNFRSYIENYFDVNGWQPQVTSLISSYQLIKDYYVADISTTVYHEFMTNAATAAAAASSSAATDDEYLAFVLDENRSNYSITNFLDGISMTFGPDQPAKLLHVKTSAYYKTYPVKWYDLEYSPGELLVYTVEPSEYYIYGSSRLGVLKHYKAKPSTSKSINKTALKSYELSDHLGNVHATVSDKKLVADTDNDDEADKFVADLRTSNDYFPYGMIIPSRDYNYNPLELVNGFDTVQRSETTETLKTEIKPDFAGDELDQNMGLWEATTYGDNGSLLSQHDYTNSVWEIKPNLIELQLHENNAQRAIVRRHLNTNELSTFSQDDRIEMSFRISKHDYNIGNLAPILTAEVRLINNANGNIQNTQTINWDYDGQYQTVYVNFTALSDDYTVEVEFEYVPSNLYPQGPWRIMTIRSFYLKHYDVVTTTYDEVVNNVFEKQGIYRYGFNGMERDDELKGIGNSWNYTFRMYDPRLGKFLSVDPIGKNYPFITPYAFAENQPIWAIDLEGLEKFKVTGRTFIPMEQLDNPQYIPHLNEDVPYAFAGDSRMSYDLNSTSYRTEQAVSIDFPNRSFNVDNNTASGTKGLDKRGKIMEESDPARAGSAPRVTNSGFLQNGNSITVRFSVGAANKLAAGAPEINYGFDLTITPLEDGSFDYSLSGSADGFPAYEFWIEDQESGESFLLFNYNPIEAGETPWALAAPMENGYLLRGNSKDLISRKTAPLEKTKNSPEAHETR